MAFQSLLYLCSSRKLKPVRKQQKDKTITPRWCGVEMCSVFCVQTQDTLSGWVLRELPEHCNLPSALGKAVQSAVRVVPAPLGKFSQKE